MVNVSGRQLVSIVLCNLNGLRCISNVMEQFYFLLIFGRKDSLMDSNKSIGLLCIRPTLLCHLHYPPKCPKETSF